MAAEWAAVSLRLFDNLNRLSGDEIKVLLFLVGTARLAADGERVTTTAHDAELATDLGPWAFDRALRSLVASGAVEQVGADGYRPTKEWTDGQAVAVIAADARAKSEIAAERDGLLREVARLKAGDHSGLAEGLKGEDRAVVLEIEGLLSRALTMGEAYWLARMMERFGPERVKKVVRMKQSSKDPLRAAYAVLFNGGLGKPIEKPDRRVERQYWRPAGTFDPWSSS